jgi:hypothetical protein
MNNRNRDSLTIKINVICDNQVIHFIEHINCNGVPIVPQFIFTQMTHNSTKELASLCA